MVRLAVDIALIPDAHLMDQVLAINAELVSRHQSDIVLHADNCLPHVSLAMGGIAQEDVRNIHQILCALWRLYPLDDSLYTQGLAHRISSQGQTVCSVEIVKDKDLQTFHEKVIEWVSPFFKYRVTEDMFVGAGPINEAAVARANTFKEKSSDERFRPHITLGYGRVEGITVRDRFYADHLDLCQLGNHCTCQKVLVSV